MFLDRAVGGFRAAPITLRFAHEGHATIERGGEVVLLVNCIHVDWKFRLITCEYCVSSILSHNGCIGAVARLAERLTQAFLSS